MRACGGWGGKKGRWAGDRKDRRRQEKSKAKEGKEEIAGERNESAPQILADPSLVKM